ncbi:MAG: family 16 glycoside hydrolase [Rubripirellula sp.]
MRLAIFSETPALALTITLLLALSGDRFVRAEEPAADLKVVTQDPDFPIQGEYLGKQKGMQVIGVGDGEFDIVVYEGGLPGAGAASDVPRRLEGDADTVEQLVESMELKRVERRSPTLGSTPPAGAVVLFDGTQESVDQHWRDGKLSANGLLMQGTISQDLFQDYTLHLEFRCPWMPTKSGQARGNSGVYHQGRYETQVLDSFGQQGRMNESGGIYSVRDPDLNMCLPPMTWQTYDVDFTAARYDAEGKKTSDARMTVRLNGVVVQNDVTVPKTTTAAKLKESPDPGPIYLQDHGNPVRFRNIWVQPRDSQREARRPIVPGFERFYADGSSSLSEGGRLLINSLACDACHRSADERVLPRKRGPVLAEVGSRVRPDALVEMIAQPHGAKPGTTMPIVWHDVAAPTRRHRAEAIASYLLLSGAGDLVDRPITKQIAEKGEQLYHRVGCVACHPSFSGEATPKATTIPLGKVDQKYTVLSLAKFLRHPHDLRPGLRMPALVGTDADAVAIAAYLTRAVTVRESTAKFRRRIYRGEWAKLPDFEQLEPVKSDSVSGLQINDIKPVNNYGVVFEAELPIAHDGSYVFTLASDDGSRLRIGDQELLIDGIHPRETRQATFDLTAGLHKVRVEFFNGGGGAELSLKMDDPSVGNVDIASLIVDPANPVPKVLLPSKFEPLASLVDEGRQLFRTSGCVNCHAMGPPQPSVVQAPPLNRLRVDRGCLAASVPSGAVDYELNPTQRAALAARLTQISADSDEPDPWQVDDAQRVHLTMAALNCYACHRRGELGGPELARDSHFQTTTPEMGLEGRIPPPLDGVGDKLNDAYLETLLEDGARLRKYMRTRMPGYRYQALRPLHQSLARLDRRDEMNQAESNQANDKVLNSGRRAVGNKGLACIKCHSYGGNKGGGIGAIDMLNMSTRLRESWFHRYLQDPVAYRPGTRMPNSFVDGRSALTDLYDGDPTLQIDAMWRYLEAGKDAKEPEGLKQGTILLAPTDQPRIYRNFFQDVSGRGIGVGYPGDINLIWDAERMSIPRVWKNSFIDASMHWRNRGQGRQQPLGDSIVEIDRRTPFAVLATKDAAWPQQSGRELGYRFRGYRLDKEGNPSFRYSIGEISIVDTPRPERTGETSSIVRTIEIENPTDQPVTWLIAEGEIQQVGDRFSVDGNVELAIDGVACELLDGGKSLRAVVPPGNHRMTETIRW